jgi:hypothetical protein
MIFFAAFIFTGVVVAGLAWFLIEALETALDVEGDL